jgi:phospholipid N-methyltransferase
LLKSHSFPTKLPIIEYNVEFSLELRQTKPDSNLKLYELKVGVNRSHELDDKLHRLSLDFEPGL